MDEPSRIAQTDEELEEFRLLVRQGRLFEVQEWVAQGKPVFKSASKKRQALEIAVEQGFHSMVDVLSKVWPDAQSMNYAAQRAIGRRRVDLVWVFIKNGVDPKAISLDSIAECNNKELMLYFLERWDEVADDWDLYYVVCARPRPLTGLLREWAPRLPNNEIQLARALSYFIQEKSQRWVGLSLWMGANPRKKVPSPSFGRTDDDPEEWITPLEMAMVYGNYQALKMIKPNPALDDVQALLNRVSPDGPDCLKIIELLLSSGAILNDRPDGTSKVLTRILFWPIWKIRYERLTWAEEMIQKGARFGWEENYEKNDTRKFLYEFSDYTLKPFLRTLASACEPSVMAEFLNTPKFKKILDLDTQKLKKFVEGLYKAERRSNIATRNLRNDD